MSGARSDVLDAAPADRGGLRARRGEALFRALSVLIVVVEAAVMGALVWVLLGSRTVGAPPHSLLQDALVAAVTATASLLAVATATLAVLRSAGAGREGRDGRAEGGWSRAWERVLDGLDPCPAGPIDDEARSALLALSESVTGARLRRATAAVRQTGTDAVLTGRLDAVRGARRGRTARRSFAWRGRSTAATLDVLDDLARARLPEALPALLMLVRDRKVQTRLHAVRAAARTISRIDDDGDRSARSRDLLECIGGSGLARGALDETLVLLGRAAPPFVRAVLTDRNSSPPLLASSLDAVARLRLSRLGPLVVSHLDDRAPLDVRAAALRALGSLPGLPAGSDEPLRRALADPVDVVRAQASRAARLLPPSEGLAALNDLLADPSWWVRRAAAEALAAAGPIGRAALRDATRTHPDRFARQMAAQVLADRALETPSDAGGRAIA